MHERITPGVIESIVDLVPDEWLQWDGVGATPDQLRSEYKRILSERLAGSNIFVNQAINSHNALI